MNITITNKTLIHKIHIKRWHRQEHALLALPHGLRADREASIGRLRLGVPRAQHHRRQRVRDQEDLLQELDS